MEAPDAALSAYLKSETLERLQALARTSRPAQNYLKGLEACAFFLAQAKAFDSLPEHPGPGEIDRIFDEMSRAINLTFGDLSNLEILIDELTGYTSPVLLQRKQQIVAHHKIALLERIVWRMAHK